MADRAIDSVQEWRARKLPGGLLFQDQFGFRYRMGPHDPVRLNRRRKAVGDSLGVTRYVLRHVSRVMLPGTGHSVRDLLLFWEGLSYRLYRLDEDGNLGPIPVSWPEGEVGDCVAVAETEAGGNEGSS